MHIAISAPIKKEFQKEVESLFPDCQISWMEEMSEEERKQAILAAQVLLSHNLVGDLLADELTLLDHPQMVQTTRTGVDHLRMDQLPKGMHLYCNAGGWARGIAESTVGMIIALNRCLREQLSDLRKGDFHILGYHQKSLMEQTVLIAGFGGIGEAVAKALIPFCCRLEAISRHKPQSPLLAAAYEMNQWEQAVSQADVLVLALPHSKETDKIVDAHVLSLMKDDAMIVDVSRAGLIDHEALVERVKKYPNFHVAMDVWWGEHDQYPKQGDPLLAYPNVIGSAHNAEMNSRCNEEAIRNALQNIRHFLDGKPVKGYIHKEEYLWNGGLALGGDAEGH